MWDSPTIHSTFSVVSGELCFGSLHNIWFGSSAPSQGLPVAPPQPEGTVIAHSINYNVAAQKGTWKVFKLVAPETSHAVAWFVAHEDVDPRQEVDKILRISGSPYEPDHGSTMNNDATSQAGVFVINRYDWTYYDTRCFDEIGQGQEEDDDTLANANSLGLVDRSVAQELVQRWQGQRPSRRDSAEHGIWLYIPDGEYMFGRFGFDGAHTAARSFLFFSANTEFTKTSFSGNPGVLREYITPQEKFDRQLREGVDFSGMDKVQHLVSSQLASPPPASELLGPYNPSDYILREQDIEALRSYHERHATHNGVEFSVDPWKQPLFDLVNEIALSYLEHFVLPHLGGENVAEMAKTLFPEYERDSQPISLDVASYRHFTQPDQSLIPDFDMSHVSVRLREFLQSRRQDKSRVFRDDAVRGMCRVLGYVFTELIIVGATGYVGSGVLRQALTFSDVTSVIAVTRRPLEQTAAKLQNVVVPDYGTYSAAAKEAFAGAGACIWTVGVTPRHAFRMDPEEVRKVCQDYTMAGLEAMRSSGVVRPFRVAYLSGVAVSRDANQSLWIAPKYRRIRTIVENQVVAFAKDSDGAVEAVIAKPGFIPAQRGILVTAQTAISRSLGISTAEAVVLDDLAIALIDQVVHGIEKDPLWPADLNRLAQKVKDKKDLN
ncbi:hypothetical protein F52700_10588 [Fusarium sp. NRRL 52700]|nr:hypothetical protein F52700_10588 [Fusarium sp. NRRL 52700]